MNKAFRAVEWMRAARARIEAEDANLNWEEQKRRTLMILEKDPLWAKLKTRSVEPSGFVRTKS